MQIIVELPDDVARFLMESSFIPVGYFDSVHKALRNGTVLPKGHGRLGDLDELETYFKNVRRQLKPEDYKYAVEYFTRDNMLLNAEQFIHLMDAVVPAMEVDDEN